MAIVHYRIGDDLYQYNDETSVYRKRNAIEWLCYTKEEFEALGESKKIKRAEFSRLMNLYFKDIKHKWTYDGKNFKKLANFESESPDYDHLKVPTHRIEKYSRTNLYLVYHWGRVYFFTWSYNGYAQGQLICTKTMSLVRWAKAKHCAPIMNTDNKVIV